MTTGDLSFEGNAPMLSVYLSGVSDSSASISFFERDANTSLSSASFLPDLPLVGWYSLPPGG